MDKKIAILGNYNTILGFKAVGVTAWPITTKEEAIDSLNKIKESNEFAVIFITEDWLDKLSTDISEIFNHQPLPAVVGIPSSQGSTGASLKHLSKIVEKAVGSDILA